MHFSLEQVRNLRNNKYAASMAEVLFTDIYPDIIFLMNKLGVFNLEFLFGTDKRQEVLKRNYDIEIVLSKGQSGDVLNIIIKKFYYYNQVPPFGGEAILEKKIEESHSFVFSPNDNRNYYFSAEGEDRIKMPTKEPFFCLFTHYDCPYFKTTTELYLFYCENIIRLAEELRHKYCDGFLDLEIRAKKISFPLERKVILEKVLI